MSRFLARLTIPAFVAAALSLPALAQDLAPPPRNSALSLWYRTPASNWNEALPIGNARLGAMVFGGVEHERLQLNEETLWTGGPYDPVVKGSAAALPEIRRLLFAGDIVRAHDLFGRRMMGKPYEQMKYSPLGDLLLSISGEGAATEYRRELDLDEAITRVSYRRGGVTFTREVFASAPDQVIVVRLTADRPGAITLSAELHGVRNPAHSNYGTDYFWMDSVAPNALRLTGKNSDYLGIEGKLRYEARVVARITSGTVGVEHRTLRVTSADTVVLLIAAATNFVSPWDVSGDPEARVREALDRASKRSYDMLRQDHVAEYQQWFRRVSMSLGGTPPDVGALPTDERIRRLAPSSSSSSTSAPSSPATAANARPDAPRDARPDPALAALYYQFGRYLLISSSRPGTQPANLQGIWNDNPNPWWDSKYTININLPMNYWPAESGNLAELTEPLQHLVRDLASAGAETAREHWGARGWVVHQNTDLWRATAPMDGPSWGAWPVGGAWLMTNLYEHYRFSGDERGLRDLYPLLRGQVQFLLDILVEHPGRKWLVTAPSNSPENFPAWPGNGKFFDEVSGIELDARTMTAGPTMDNQIIREVFAEFAEAAQTLHTDSALAAQVRAARARLAPNQIGKHGQLQEWLDDWDELEPQHRHLSPLWGLYPGREITPDSAPIAKAAEVTLDRRGTGGCGWSYAWKMGLRARLAEGDSAWAQFRALLGRSTLPNLVSLCGRAFQVDGNFGATAAIAELLVQSHDGDIHLIPALPNDWPSGEVRGLRARGGYEVDVVWDSARLTRAVVRASRAGQVVVRSAVPLRVTRNGRRVAVRRLGKDRIAFAGAAGGEYVMVEGK